MQDEVKPLSKKDETWLQQAEQHILQVLQAHYGNCEFTYTERDLVLVQRLIDDGFIKSDQLLEQQCLGVVLGNVFTHQTRMRWSVVTNDFGTLIAIYDAKIKFTLYPITMISQRMDDRRKIDMPALYKSFVADLSLTN